ncbi:MAG: hypothetical protein KDD15_30845, partial [Lewinella sp.]|nr:hypothetical protein [Lewinella sp.]
MNQKRTTRRQVLAGLAALGGATLLPAAATARVRPEVIPAKKEETFTFSLNTSTIMGHKQGIVKDIQTIAK